MTDSILGNGSAVHESPFTPLIALEQDIRRFRPDVSCNTLIEHAWSIGASDIFIAAGPDNVDISVIGNACAALGPATGGSPRRAVWPARGKECA